MSESKSKRPFEVFVRWLDGYLEWFTADEIRISETLITMRLASEHPEAGNRQIPLRNVRWYSIYPEDHEALYLKEMKDEKSVSPDA